MKEFTARQDTINILFFLSSAKRVHHWTCYILIMIVINFVLEPCVHVLVILMGQLVVEL